MSWAQYYRRTQIQMNIAQELIARGWTCHQYKAPERDPDTDYHFEGIWSGVATHPQLPDVIIGIYAERFDTIEMPSKALTVGQHLIGNDPDYIPGYVPTPKGKSWHIERYGDVAATGRFPKAVGEPIYRWSKNEQIIKQQVDKLERIAGRLK
jgi:hypothetical protein